MPSVYVGTYRDYNEGSLKGAWLDLEDYADKREFEEACQELHGPGEHEFMFQDFEDIPRIFISESWIDPELWDYLDFDDGYKGDAKAAFVSWYGSWDESKFEEAIRGKTQSELDYTYEFIDEIGLLASMPDNLKGYFDYEKFSRDLFMGDFTFQDGFVFDATV